MKNLLIGLVLLTASCGIVEEATKSCQKIVAEQTTRVENNVWQRCQNYYETMVLPSLQGEIYRLYLAFGCYSLGNGYWDCTNICRTCAQGGVLVMAPKIDPYSDWTEGDTGSLQEEVMQKNLEIASLNKQIVELEEELQNQHRVISEAYYEGYTDAQSESEGTQ